MTTWYMFQYMNHDGETKEHVSNFVSDASALFWANEFCRKYGFELLNIPVALP